MTDFRGQSFEVGSGNDLKSEVGMRKSEKGAASLVCFEPSALSLERIALVVIK